MQVDSDGAAVVIRAGGEIDLATAAAIPEAALGVADIPSGAPVFIDLSEVEFMDSSGLRGLLQARRVIGDAGRPFALLRPSAAVCRVLDLVALDDHLPVVGTTDDDGPAAQG